jgi:hypothetical protein
VLLGAGLLTAGYFLWPEEDPIQKAEDSADGGGGSSSSGRVTRRYRVLVPIVVRSSSSPALARPGAVSRGGFGGSGGRFVGG